MARPLSVQRNYKWVTSGEAQLECQGPVGRGEFAEVFKVLTDNEMGRLH